MNIEERVKDVGDRIIEGKLTPLNGALLLADFRDEVGFSVVGECDKLPSLFIKMWGQNQFNEIVKICAPYVMVNDTPQYDLYRKYRDERTKIPLEERTEPTHIG